MVQAEPKTEHKSHSSPIKNAPDKLSSVLNNRTLRDMTNLLEPYKRNPSETPITTLTHILHCYDRTHKFLQTLDLDSQRITQSTQAIQSALETITTLFNSTNLHLILLQKHPFFFLLLPYSFRTSPLLLLLQHTLVMAPNAEVEDIITMTSSQSKVHSLKAAIFHTMA